MKLIEKYVEAVVSHLPEESKKEVRLELKSNILDMLPEDYTEAEVIDVLEGMGNPSSLADEYVPGRRYLIGPALYDRYIATLKMVLTIVAVSFTAIICFKWLVTGDITSSSSIIGTSVSITADIVSTIIMGLLQATFWVTLIFVLLDRYKVIDGQDPFKKEAWHIGDLDKLTISTKNKISRVKIIIEMCFTIFFTFLIYLQPSNIAAIMVGGEGTVMIPLFNLDTLRSFMPLILLVAILSLSISLWKLVLEHWTLSLAFGNTILNIVSAIVVVTIFTHPHIFTGEIYDYIAGAVAHSTVEHLRLLADNGLKIGLVAFVLISVWDSIDGFLRSRNTLV